MCTRRQVDYISQMVVNAYRKIYGESIVKILLYGSYARNEETDDSDIDIVAIVDGNRIDLQNKLKDVWSSVVELGVENGVIISPTVVPTDEFEHYKSELPYYMNIEKEGVQIG